MVIFAGYMIASLLSIFIVLRILHGFAFGMVTVAGNTILIDDGLIEMTVEQVSENKIVCRVVNGGPVSNHKGVNVPRVNLSMPYISEQDRADIIFGIENDFDFIAASFVRAWL